MTKLFVGIDFSLNSTGLVFRYNGNTKYINVLNKFAISSSKKMSAGEIFSSNEVLNSIIGLKNVTVKPLDIAPITSVKKIGLSEWERLHIAAVLNRGIEVYNAIADELSNYKLVKLNDIHMKIENYSYGSNTDNLIQVVEATMKLKQMLFENMGLPLENFHLITGPTLKMWVGKGNYDKYQMLEAYLRNDKEDRSLENDPLWRTLGKNKEMYLNKKTKKGKPYLEVKTPISDIIDAYYCCLHLERELS